MISITPAKIIISIGVWKETENIPLSISVFEPGYCAGMSAIRMKCDRLHEIRGDSEGGSKKFTKTAKMREIRASGRLGRDRQRLGV